MTGSSIPSFGNAEDGVFFMRFALIVCALGLILKSGCFSPVLADDTVRLTGVIVDAGTGEPIPGAKVSVEGRHLVAEADSSGRFILDGFGAGPQRLWVERIGYAGIFVEVTASAEREAPIRLTMSPEALQVEGISVTGRRGANDIETAPTFATVIEAKNFQRRTTSLPELLSETAGVHVESMGGLGSFSTISIRGSSAEQVQVYLDGVLLNSAFGGGVNLSDIPVSDVERIEIYRGKAPIWTGGEGMGGAVHIRTWNTGDRQVQRGSASIGSFGTGKGSWTLSQRHGRMGMLAAVDYSRSANDFRFRNDNGTEYNPADDGFEQRRNNDFASMSLLTKVSYDEAGRFSGSFSNSFYRKAQGMPNIGNNQARHARFEVTRDLIEGFAEIRGLVNGRMTLRQTLSFSHVAEDFEDRFGEVGLGNQDNHNRSQAFAFRQAIQSLVGRNQVTSVFYEVRRETFKPSDRLAPAARFFNSLRWTFAGGGEQNGYLFNGRLGVVSSVRVESRRSRFVEEIPYLYSPLASIHKRSDVTWSVHEGVRGTLLPGVIVKGNFGKYNRAPSFYELFGDRGGVIGNTDLKAERGLTWDVGFRGEWAGKGTGEIVYFDRRAKDLIQFVQHSQGVSRAHNLSRARIRGIEVVFNGTFGEIFKVSGNYTHQRARDRSRIPHRRNKILPNRPQHEGHGKGEVRVGGANLTYAMAFEGGSFLDGANLRLVRARVIHNTGVSFNLIRSVKATGEVKNLTNNQVADVWGYPLPGRGYFAGVSGQF